MRRKGIGVVVSRMEDDKIDLSINALNYLGNS
jgi:hypothetical protein